MEALDELRGLDDLGVCHLARGRGNRKRSQRAGVERSDIHATVFGQLARIHLRARLCNQCRSSRYTLSAVRLKMAVFSVPEALTSMRLKAFQRAE